MLLNTTFPVTYKWICTPCFPQAYYIIQQSWQMLNLLLRLSWVHIYRKWNSRVSPLRIKDLDIILTFIIFSSSVCRFWLTCDISGLLYDYFPKYCRISHICTLIKWKMWRPFIAIRSAWDNNTAWMYQLMILLKVIFNWTCKYVPI